MIDGIREVLVLNTPGFEHRAIEKPANENAIKGPKEAFVESAQINRSLLRKQLKTSKLATDYLLGFFSER
jgi:spore germination protein KA